MVKRAVVVAAFVVVAAAGDACSCGATGPGAGPLIVADRFTQAGATGTTNEAVERMHPYIVRGTATLDVRTHDWFVDVASLQASSSDESVFVVQDQQVGSADPSDFFAMEKALSVTIAALAEGTADIVFSNSGGGVVDRRTIRVVVPDALALEFPMTVPGIPDPSLDPTHVRVGSLGADLLVAFEAGGERAHGLGALALTSSFGGFIELAKTSLSVPRGIPPEREVLRVRPGFSSHAAVLQYGGDDFAVVDVDGVNEEEVAEIDFVKHETLADFLDDNAGVDVPDEIVNALRNSNDAKILCGDDRCVARVNTTDADGATIVGESIVWNVDVDVDDDGEPDDNVNGDILTFKKALGASSKLTATANGISRNITIDGDEGSVQVLRSTSAHCAQAGGDTVAVVGVAGLAFRFRRRRRG